MSAKPDGGIGRRAGLKHLWENRAGSTWFQDKTASKEAVFWFYITMNLITLTLFSFVFFFPFRIILLPVTSPITSKLLKIVRCRFRLLFFMAFHYMKYHNQCLIATSVVLFLFE
jgi:hypothetical protein